MKTKLDGIVLLVALAASAYGQATALSGTVRVWPQITHAKTIGGSTISEEVGQIVEQDFTLGTNANQMTKWAASTVAMTNGEAVTLSLLGGVSNNFGDALTFSRVNFLGVVASTGNTATVVVGGAAANAFSSWLGDASDAATVNPGGCIVAFAPSATGYAVSTNGNLKMLNAGTNAATVYLYIGGN